MTVPDVVLLFSAGSDCSAAEEEEECLFLEQQPQNVSACKIEHGQVEEKKVLLNVITILYIIEMKLLILILTTNISG